MTIKYIVDTREQLPLSVGTSKTRKYKKLNVGDYGLEIDGELQKISVERKSPEDLIATVTSGHKRFKKEIQRAIDNKILLYILIECSYTTVRDFTWLVTKCKTKGETVLKICHTLELKYGVRFVFCNSRKEMIDYINRLFDSYKKNRGVLYYGSKES